MCWSWGFRFQEMGLGGNGSWTGRRWGEEGTEKEVLWGIAEMYRIWVASSSVPMRESMALGMELPGAGCKYPIVLCLTVVQLVVRLLKSFFFFPHGWITVLAVQQGWPCTCVHGSVFNQASWKSYFSWTFVSIKLRLTVHLLETILVSGKTE